MGKLQDFEHRYQQELVVLKEKGRLIEDWANVYRHCFTEGLIANVFAELLQLPSEEQEPLVKAALLHDWYKRNEREAVNKEGFGQYDAKAKESARLLRSFGYSEEIVELTESVGHTSLKDIQNTQSFLKKLMHYIDDIALSDKVVALDKRIDQLEAAERYKELNESGRTIFNGRTYFEVQRAIGHEIEKEVAARVGIEASELITLVQGKLQNDYNVSS
ncbi:MAG: HD domain-containing protein [Patescibacteria group bacterium]